MKELSIEEKAKAYDEVLEKARLILQDRGNEPDGASMLSDLFPKLKESEDEKIRKAIIDVLKAVYECADIPFISQKQTLDSYVSYLEKQGKQKPAWSEEDERHLNSIIKRTVAYGDSSVYGLIKDDIDWLKFLKDRV